MQTYPTKSRVLSLAVACVAQYACLGLVFNPARAQDASPFERNVSGESGTWQRSTVNVPEGMGSLEVVLSGGTGDADLFVRFGAEPSGAAYDCRSNTTGEKETCRIPNPQAGDWQIGIEAYSTFSGVTLRATWSPALSAQEWQQAIVSKHNVHRAKHCAPAVVWDEEVAASAQRWADQCKFSHDDPTNTELGESLAGGIAGDSAEAPVDDWYSEVSAYDFANPGFSTATGHFTQLVWKGTTKIGCAIKSCPASIFRAGRTGEAPLIVCRYAPRGNMRGEYEANVSPEPAGGVCQ